MKKFEYCRTWDSRWVIREWYEGENDGKFHIPNRKELAPDRFTKEGWELISVCHTDTANDFCMYFKREINANSGS